MSLRGVLEHEQAVARSERVDPLHVAHLPVQVHGDHRRRARADQRGRGIGIDQPGVPLHVAEDRRRPGVQHAQRRRDERVPGHQHLVARPDPGGDQRQRERGRAGGDPHALGRLTVVGELPLERLDLAARG